MTLSKDWREFLELLNSRGDRHRRRAEPGISRAPTPHRRLGHSVRPTPDNARLLLALLNQFGFEQSSFKKLISSSPSKSFNSGESPTELIC